jgi:tetratricopeptide (TPR) repeat protein
MKNRKIVTNGFYLFPLFLPLFLLSFPHCGARRVAGWEKGEIVKTEGDLPQILKDASDAWNKRDNPSELKKALDLYEQAVRIKPDQYEVLELLSRGYYFYAEAYLRKDPEEQLRYYDISAQWGERAMALFPEFKKKVVEEGVKVEDAVSVLPESFVGAVYWSASAIGKWARLKGFTTILSQRSRIKKLMTWVTEKNPRYFYGGPYRYWGAYYAIAPAFAGGDLKKSKEYFEKSLEVEPNYFGTKVLYADTYATKAQDRPLYERLLKEVLEGDPAVLPDIVPEQKVEQEKAKELLDLVEDRFAGTFPLEKFVIAVSLSSP